MPPEGSSPQPLVGRDEQLDGLGCLVADLLTDNLADGTRQKLLVGRCWATTIDVVDAESRFVVEVGEGQARVLSGSRTASSLRIRIDGDTLVALPEVRLIAGLPDPRTTSGRTTLRKLLSRDLRIGGLLLHPVRLRRLLTLLNTA